MERELVKLQNLPIDTFTFDEALEYTKKGQVITINPEMIFYASKHPEFANIIKEAELVIPDGIGVQIGLKILGHNVRRIAGIEFGRKILEKYSAENKTCALIGAKPEVIEKAVENLQKEVKNINIVYSHDGYFKDDSEILNNLTARCPDVVLTALGAPKQEEFNYKAKKLLPNTLFIGVGGSFDVWAGVVKRAPNDLEEYFRHYRYL